MRAEVAGCRHHRLAEVVHPDAIDDHPRGQRVVSGRDRLGQVEPATAVGEWTAVGAGYGLEELSRNPVARLISWVGRHEGPRIVQLFSIEKHHRPRRDVGGLHRQPIQLGRIFPPKASFSPRDM